MNTIKKIISICVISFLLISVFFLILRTRSFTNKKLDGYAIKNNDINVAAIPKGTLQQDILREGETGLPIYPFAVGEKLKYFIYSARIKVGEVNITYLGRRDIRGVLRDVVLLEAQAPGFMDREEIYGDIATFTPARVMRKIKFFGETLDITEEYEENANEVLITRKARKTTVQRIITEGKMSNIVLLLYHFRNKKDEYRIGRKIGFNLPMQKLEMVIDKEARIKVPKGDFTALFIKSVPSRFKVWFRINDGMPLRIQGAIGFGNTYLDLKDIE